jgi:hypothetical protein
MKKLTKLSLLASVSLSLAGPAWAQVSPGPNDLILDFRAYTGTDGTGTGNTGSDLEVDLGSYTQFELGGSGFTNNSSTELNVNDLTGTFGSTWATDGTIVFSVAGDTDTAGNDGSGFFTQSKVVPQSDGSGIGNAVSAVDELVSSLSNLSPTANSSGAGVFTNANSSNSVGSYTNEETAAYPNNSLAFGYFNRSFGASAADNISDIEAVVQDTGSTTSTSLALYSYDDTTGTPLPPVLQGVFTLSDTGALTYATAEVPEPSAWAMILCGAGLLFLAVRRRWISNLN